MTSRRCDQPCIQLLTTVAAAVVVVVVVVVYVVVSDDVYVPFYFLSFSSRCGAMNINSVMELKSYWDYPCNCNFCMYFQVCLYGGPL